MARRGVAALVLLPAALVLSGCALTGTVDVEGAEAVVDLVVTYRTVPSVTNFEGVRLPLGTDYCAFSFTGVTSSPLPAPEGQTSCRFTGSIGILAPEGSVGGMLTVARSSGHYFVATPEWTLTQNPRDRLDSLDVTVTFPGRVIAASAGGEVDGSSVRWRDADAARTEGLHVTAADAPSLPTGWVPATLGALFGAAVVGAALALRARRRSDAASSPAVAPVMFPTGAAPRSIGAGPAPTRGAGAPTTSDPMSEQPDDPSVWGRPD